MKQVLYYHYADGNLFETPNTYSYTTYHGDAFLSGWRAHRNQFMQINNTLQNDSHPSSTGETDTLLKTIKHNLTRQPNDLSTLKTLDKLLKRFEVSKRLHANYESNWKPTNPNDYKNNERYILFAEILDIAYQSTNFLAYLNCLLKVIDTICSQYKNLTIEELKRLNSLITKESNHVTALISASKDSLHAS